MPFAGWRIQPDRRWRLVPSGRSRRSERALVYFSLGLCGNRGVAILDVWLSLGGTEVRRRPALECWAGPLRWRFGRRRCRGDETSGGRLRRERTHLLARAHVIANRLQPFQNALPLGPIELSQIRPKTLNERVLQHRFTVRFGYEKAVQANAQRLGDFFKCSEAGGHLATFDPREVRTGNARAGLQLALRHAAGFAQLADPLADILDGLAVRPILEQLTVVTG